MMRSSKGFPPVCDEDLIETIRQSKEVVPPALDGIWEDHVVVAVEGSTQQSHRQAYSLRTTMGGDVRFRIFLAFACFCSAFIFYQSMCAAIQYVHPQPAHRYTKSSPICVTPGCVVAASELIHSISPKYKQIDPCEDFRSYVCEGWDMEHDLREDQADVFTGTIMHENSQILLRHILEAPFPRMLSIAKSVVSADEENFDKMKAAYRSCMDESTIKAQQSLSLIELLKRVRDLFPAEKPYLTDVAHLYDSAQQQVTALPKGKELLSGVLTYLMNLGIDALVSFSVDADDKDPNNTVITVTAPQPGLPSKEYYKDERLIKSYKETIGQVFEGLVKEANPSDSFLSSILHERLVDALVDFETELANASPDPENAQDVTKYYNPRSLQETQALLPELSFERIISSKKPDRLPDKLIIGSPEYLKAVSAILQRSTKQTVQLYLFWKLVQAYGSDVESDALKPLKRFNNVLRGKDPEVSEERWRTCVTFVDRGLGWILSRFYVDRAFSTEAKDFGDLIISDIKDQFVKKLSSSKWMSDEVRKLGISKVHNIKQKIGYPAASPNIRDPGELQDWYSAVDISELAFLNNSVSMNEASVAREWSRLGKPTDRNLWLMSAPTVNAYYNPAGNEIVFPAGILQSPVFYEPSIPRYLSYGAFGSVSGHELSHAFDSMGRHYDQTGNYTNWWDNSTIKAFEAKAQCFVDQYHAYNISDPAGKAIPINGRLTLGENIADAGGVSAAFAAWKAREAESPSELLPGLQHFSKEQLFFISYGNWWCGKTRLEEQVRRIYIDPHSPFFARILGTVANSRDFRESFQCKVKEPTCELW